MGRVSYSLDLPRCFVRLVNSFPNLYSIRNDFGRAWVWGRLPATQSLCHFQTSCTPISLKERRLLSESIGSLQGGVGIANPVKVSTGNVFFPKIFHTLISVFTTSVKLRKPWTSLLCSDQWIRRVIELQEETIKPQNSGTLLVILSVNLEPNYSLLFYLIGLSLYLYILFFQVFILVFIRQL